jgi:sulfur-carrier protein
MITVSFAAHLQRHVPCPDQTVEAGTLAQVLTRAFVAAPAMRDYVLDNQGHIRKHVAVFINGQLYLERNQMERVLADNTKIHVIQALSGG